MSESNKLETWGNETNMNLNPIIYQNILASPYFKSLYDKKTYHEIIDEIYNEVYTLEPFMKGTTASTAFCLLFKLWTQRLTIKQIEGLIDHGDSPYIRGIGFLYLRYVCAPKQLWDWLGPYIDDEEEIDITHAPKPVKSTIGKLCRHLLTDIKYHGTMLPRIPVPIARDIEKKIADYDRESKGRNGSRGSDYRARESYSDGGRKRSRDDSRRRDDSRGSRYDRDGRTSRSRSPYRRDRSYHGSRERSRHDSRDRSRHDSRDRYRRRERSPSPRDEFEEYERRSKRDDERRRHSRDSYRDRSHDRSYDKSYRRRSRSRDNDRRR